MFNYEIAPGGLLHSLVLRKWLVLFALLTPFAVGRAGAEESGLPLHGFADVGWANGSKNQPGKSQGFYLGTFDLYLTPQFSDKGKSIIEIALEPDDGAYHMDVERMQLGYTFSDLATVWVGRYHTPYGYWNTAFHHGAQIQTSTTRPRFVEFEDGGGIFPAHTVGILLSGTTRAGTGRINYDLYSGNGSRIADGIQDPNIQKDDNSSTVYGLNGAYLFGGALSGLRLGLHGWTQKVNSYLLSVLQSSTQTLVYGGYAVFENHGFEFISEYYRLADKDAQETAVDKQTHQSSAYFAQLGYTMHEQWTPFVRVEEASLNQADRYLLDQTGARSYARQSVGLKYDLDERAALKAEMLFSEDRTGVNTKYNEGKVQYAIRF